MWVPEVAISSPNSTFISYALSRDSQFQQSLSWRRYWYNLVHYTFTRISSQYSMLDRFTKCPLKPLYSLLFRNEGKERRELGHFQLDSVHCSCNQCTPELYTSGNCLLTHQINDIVIEPRKKPITNTPIDVPQLYEALHLVDADIHYFSRSVYDMSVDQ
jgi:hypothetical protein